MKIPRIVLAGATSGVGKTSITCSIIYALQKRGFSVQPFKVGPDYIDPSYLTTISKNETYNLDVWLMGQKQVLDSFVLTKASLQRISCFLLPILFKIIPAILAFL